MASFFCLIGTIIFGVLLAASCLLTKWFPMLGMILIYLFTRLTWQFLVMFYRCSAAEKVIG